MSYRYISSSLRISLDPKHHSWNPKRQPAATYLHTSTSIHEHTALHPRLALPDLILQQPLHVVKLWQRTRRNLVLRTELSNIVTVMGQFGDLPEHVLIFDGEARSGWFNVLVQTLPKLIAIWAKQVLHPLRLPTDSGDLNPSDDLSCRNPYGVKRVHWVRSEHHKCLLQRFPVAYTPEDS